MRGREEPELKEKDATQLIRFVSRLEQNEMRDGLRPC